MAGYHLCSVSVSRYVHFLITVIACPININVRKMVEHLSSDDADIKTKAKAKDAASFTKDKPVDEEGGATKNIEVKVEG